MWLGWNAIIPSKHKAQPAKHKAQPATFGTEILTISDAFLVLPIYVSDIYQEVRTPVGI